MRVQLPSSLSDIISNKTKIEFTTPPPGYRANAGGGGENTVKVMWVCYFVQKLVQHG